MTSTIAVYGMFIEDASLGGKNPRSRKGLEEIPRSPGGGSKAEGAKHENPTRLISRAYKGPRANVGRVEGLVRNSRETPEKCPEYLPRKVTSAIAASTEVALPEILDTCGVEGAFAPILCSGYVQRSAHWRGQVTSPIESRLRLTPPACRSCVGRRKRWSRTRCGLSARRKIRRPSSERCSNNDYRR